MRCDIKNQEKQNSILKKFYIQKARFIAIFLILFLFIIFIYKSPRTKSIPESQLFSELSIRISALQAINKENNKAIYCSEWDEGWEYIVKANELTDNDFEKIRELTIRFKAICDLRLLKKFTNLQKLDISELKFEESYIPQWMKILHRLGIYDLSEKCLIDFSPISNLSKLEVLDLSSTKIKNIKLLSKLKNLKELNLDNTNVSNLKSIRNITQMQKLSLSGCKIRNIEPLRNLTLLNVLNINRTQVNNLEPINNLTNLKSLNLSKTQIDNLDIIKNLTNVESLDISYTKIENFERIKALTNLKELHLPKGQNVTKQLVNDLQNTMPETSIYVNNTLQKTLEKRVSEWLMILLPKRIVPENSE